MTTRFDILDAKQALTDHIAQHHCRLGGNCEERKRLARAYNEGPNSAAGRWGLDYGDLDRQEKQARERQKA